MSQRKKYRAKVVNFNPIAVAIQGQRLIGKADQVAYALRLHNAVESISKGEATQTEWAEVTDVVNMVNVMSGDRQIMTGADEFVGLIQDTVMAILDRQKATGSKALYPEELQALRDLVSLWTEVLGVVTHHQFFKTQERVVIRVAHAIAWKSPKLRLVEPA